MSTVLKDKKQLLVDKVVQRIEEKLTNGQAQCARHFVEQYYREVAPDDLVQCNPLDLYGAALAHWNLALKRPLGKRLLRVYNPRMEQHGWQSTHTIIEIVQDDMPFLVDSTTMELNRLGLTVHLVVHPVMRVKRDDQGYMNDVLDLKTVTDHGMAEAVIRIEVDRQSDDVKLAALEGQMTAILNDISAAVHDWPKMRERVQAAIAAARQNPPPMPADDFEENLAFLEWMDRDHFIFLGFREYELIKENGGDSLRPVANTALGVSRNHNGERAHASYHLPPDASRIARQPGLLVITKSSARSTVHRPAYMDYVGVKRYDAQKNVVGEWRFLGLYTSAAYISRPKDIPLLRHKVQGVMQRSALRPNGHAAKGLVNILETLPRDELLQSSEAELHETATAILQLQERQRVRLLVRRDPFARYYTCLVYMPRERFNTDIRVRVQQLLQDAFTANSVDFTVSLSESVLARIYLTLHTVPGTTPKYDTDELETRIADLLRSWEDDLAACLLQEFGEDHGNALLARYRHAFPASYKEDYAAAIAVADIRKMEALDSPDAIGMGMYKPLEVSDSRIRFKLFRSEKPIHLSTVLPMLENMGVKVIDERPHEIKPLNRASVWAHDLGLMYEGAVSLEADATRALFQNAFAQIWQGRIENDGLNKLVLYAHIPWRGVLVLRACCKYIRQTGFPFSQSYMEHALANHPQIAAFLVDLFYARFDPAVQGKSPQRCEALIDAIEHSLDAVPNLDEDRIQRRFFVLIRAMLRTNFFQTNADGSQKTYLSFKLDPTQIPDLPNPRPLYEIFVYSTRTEGVHLRGGRVARGGLRWSDRLEDFRTEVFGLMKTQMVKNAVIVPVGAKGGFVVKQPPVEGGAEALGEEVRFCYRTFIRGLLDITDNLVGGRVVAPVQVVRYDCDDPYLVVAADKGTASFSDLANSISREYGFWLGDAFASGGSTGYDHKKIAITARGAWESVKRHFRELGKDIDNEDFTVIGIGSMNGDVTGNGLLLSRRIKLVGAFSHAHIFLDPDPDPEASFRERRRLFDLPRSSWADYNRNLISKGGGVYPRSAKSIPLSAEMRNVLDVHQEALPPNDLIQALLRANVDLLWNGGIGTFVKATTEAHSAVGDRSNDAIRVNGCELRCKMFAEGGNLGLTQNGRIEYAKRGGRINTDFIDNSGGVDCSDHEVNIKILLDEVVKNGDMSEKQRNELLAQMTEEVAGLVLQDNYQQNMELSASEQLAPALFDEHVRFLRYLEKAGRLERVNWYLPDDEEVKRRRTGSQGMTRPELSILLVFSKIDLFEELLKSDICEDQFAAGELSAYFPGPIRQRFAPLILQHRLRREIIATFISNNIVNRMGITFPIRTREQTGARMADIARGYIAARDIFGLTDTWRAIETLDRSVSTVVQMQMLHASRKLGARATQWLLRNCKQPLDIDTAVRDFRPGIQELTSGLMTFIDEPDRVELQRAIAALVEQGVPSVLATSIITVPIMFSSLDIAEVASSLQRPIPVVARLYFMLGRRLEFYWLRDQITALPEDNHWSRLARAALREDLYRLHRTLTREALLSGSASSDADALFTAWHRANQVNVDRYAQRLAEFKSVSNSDLAMLSVAVNEARKLIHTTGTVTH